MLELRNVSLNFNGGDGAGIEVLRGVNLQLERGKLYAITGPNGGGKTSLAKVVMGIYTPSQGQVLLDGEDITGLSISERARRGIAYAFQHPPRFKGLTVADIMKIARPDLDSVHMRGYLRDVGLCPEDYLERDLGPGLSGGEIKRIEVAQLLARDAEVTIFDEPEAGVDLWTIQKLLAIIVKRYKGNRQGLAVIITHNEQFLPACDEIILIDEGTVQGQGPAQMMWPLLRDDIVCKQRAQCVGIGGRIDGI
ncbi:MAG: ATP-binding cassette domain-containing protein [Syntrophomonadaceae bacterium]|nr:ATP-binding cassette domain-containing protein [Syntrophomonadaceae bacterium]MDH7497669.1 ATP-binding cassette domain-containing protein [Syntrophomonadaceae bacterium]